MQREGKTPDPPGAASDPLRAPGAGSGALCHPARRQSGATRRAQNQTVTHAAALMQAPDDTRLAQPCSWDSNRPGSPMSARARDGLPAPSKGCAAPSKPRTRLTLHARAGERRGSAPLPLRVSLYAGLPVPGGGHRATAGTGFPGCRDRPGRVPDLPARAWGAGG